MNICMFTNTFLPHVGGVARSVDTFAEDLCYLDHRVLIVAPTFPEDTDLTGEQYEVLRLPAIQNFNGSDFSLRIPIPFVINDKIDRFAPDVIHSHHPYLLGDAAIRAARTRDLPLVFTHHTLYEQYTHYVPLDSETLKRFVIELSTEYANLCAKVVAPSHSIARLLRRRGVEKPIEEIPTGIDVQFFRRGRGEKLRHAHGIPQDALVIGHLGRLAPEKNLKYLAESVAMFMENNRDAFFVVAGSGPSESEIQRIFTDRSLNEQLRMLGIVTGQDLADVYQGMDLFVFSSKSETQGMVLTEAMAAGTPVIALDASGAREVVEDGRNGRLLPENASQQSFARAIQRFTEDATRAKEWQKKALNTAHRFSRERSAERLLRLYQSILGYRSDYKNDELIPFDTILRRLKAEWELISEKTKAAAKVIKADDESQVQLE
jgi:glycosyltransferase involved in cell wall biosynthesis